MKKVFKVSIIAIFFIIFTITFFSYDMMLSYDSCEFIGLSNLIGTNKMTSEWIGHRGIFFPLFLKFPDFWGNYIGMVGFKIYYYFLYCIMMCAITGIFKKCLDNIETLNFRIIKIIIYSLIILFIILNPIIFGFFHTVLTEAIAISCICCFIYATINWLDIDLDNKKEKAKYTSIFIIISVIMYHTKQSFIPIPLGILAISTLISLINDHSKKNFLNKFITILSVVLVMVATVSIWNIVMKDSHTYEKTYEQRVSKRRKISASPSILIDYYNDYKKILCFSDKYAIDEMDENTRFLRVFLQDGEILFIGIPAPYYKYIEKYTYKIKFGFVKHENIMINIYDNFVRNTYKIYNVIIKCNMFIIPLLDILLFFIYLFIRKKMDDKEKKLLEYAIICFTTVLSVVFPYILFSAIVDRYIVPAIVPMFLGDILLILFIIYKIKSKKESK